MAELYISKDERPGIEKQIDEGAYDLIFQAIQEDMYSYPIQSFVREAISNGLDAITERQIYARIVGGEPVEKFYRTQQDGKLLKDSNFDESYYNTKYLSSNSFVQVTYKEQQGRDLISIKDYGVGLGKNRLKGFFKLGYSSKRNMKDVIGKFGAGAKAGLATGVEYFVIHTTYNGYKTSFMVFKRDYEPITPKSDSTVTDNWKVRYENGAESIREVHWEKTSDMNGVTIELEVKKHNKDAYINAVKNQFQYFEGMVRLEIISTDGTIHTEDLNEPPLYSSDNLIIPKYSTYTRPHILVGGISYGLIDWKELELEERLGRIAIKVEPTEVDITQSRESLKWTEKTKTKILESIATCESEASEYISNLLECEDTENLFEIAYNYSKVGRRADPVSSAFSKFLNTAVISPVCKFTLGDTKIKHRLNSDLLYELFYHFNVKEVLIRNNTGKPTIDSRTVSNWSDFGNHPIIFSAGKPLGPKLASHLLTNVYPDADRLIYVRPISEVQRSVAEIGKYTFSVDKVAEFTKALILKYCSEDITDHSYDLTAGADTENIDEVSIEQRTVVNKNLAAKLRKQNQEVLYIKYDSYDTAVYDRNQRKYVERIDFVRSKYTVKISEIHLEGLEDTIVTTQEYRPITDWLQRVFNGKLEVIHVAKDVLKYFLPHCTHITKYIRNIDTNTGELMIGTYFRKMNTLRLFRNIINEYPLIKSNTSVLSALTSIDMLKYNDFKDNRYVDNLEEVMELVRIPSDAKRDILGFLDNLTEFQKVVKTADKKAITEKALSLFNTDKIFHVDAYDDEFIESVQENFQRISPILPILNNITYVSNDAVDLLELLLTTLKQKDDANI